MGANSRPLPHSFHPLQPRAPATGMLYGTWEAYGQLYTWRLGLERLGEVGGGGEGGLPCSQVTHSDPWVGEWLIMLRMNTLVMLTLKFEFGKWPMGRNCTLGFWLR